MTTVAVTKSEKPNTNTWTYLLLTTLFSSFFYFLIIKSGQLAGGNRFYVLGLMWCPGLAALLTLKLNKRSFSELGWSLGDNKYLLQSYLVPFLYTLMTYVIIWTLGLGAFYNEETTNKWIEAFGLGDIPAWQAIALYLFFASTLGIIRSVGALGEEIGWRGFLVPELSKRFSFTATSIITGIVWSLYHYPILIFADYNSGTPAWYGLTCFTIMVISSCFIYTWFRIKSGSLWTGAIIHASHNLFIQVIFTPLTADTGNTKYIVDEFGVGLAISSVIFGFYFWTRRKELTSYDRTKLV